MGTKLESIIDGKSDGGGCDCEFYKINNDVGLKCYTNKFIGRKAYALQKLAYLHGLGPKPGIRIDGDNLFIFSTEILSPVDSDDFESNIEEEDGLCHTVESECHAYHDVYLALKSIGIICNDGHSDNFGYNKAGEVMLLDFGGYGYHTEYVSKKRTV